MATNTEEQPLVPLTLQVPAEAILTVPSVIIPSIPEVRVEETSTFVETPIFAKVPGTDEDPQIANLANQLATFRASPPKIGALASEFQYHQGNQKKPISLEFEEINDTKTTLRLRLRSADSGSDPKVEELAKLIKNGWNVEIKGRGFKAFDKAFEAHVYFLKYRRLEKRDIDALEKLRTRQQRRSSLLHFCG